jgi:hypothetical protein
VNSGLTNNYIYALAVSNTTLFAGTWGGGVFQSSDNGTTWQAVSSGLTDLFVWSLAVSGSTVFAGTSSELFRSIDNGTTWQAVSSSGLTNIFISSFAICDTTLFVGTYGGGVFRSSDNGTTWQTTGSGLKGSVRSLIISDKTLFAGTFVKGVFKANIGSTSSVSVRTSAPLPATVGISFAPHPVLDQTRLTLDIPKASSVEVRIFDALGRLLQQRALGELAAGAHDIEQDLHTLPNGTYSAVVQAGGERAYKLLQVLR